MRNEISYVTTNSGKYEEVSTYVAHHYPGLNIKQEVLDLPEIQSSDQRSIACDKAIKAWDVLKKPVLIDDAAIYFHRYNQFPGPLAKFVAQGLGFEGLKRLIEEGDRATRLLYFVYYDGQGDPILFEGKSEGTLIRPDVFDGDPRLPYNAFFVADGADQSNAQLREDIVLHGQHFYRIKALEAFIAWYKDKEVV